MRHASRSMEHNQIPCRRAVELLHRLRYSMVHDQPPQRQPLEKTSVPGELGRPVGERAEPLSDLPFIISGELNGRGVPPLSGKSGASQVRHGRRRDGHRPRQGRSAKARPRWHRRENGSTPGQGQNNPFRHIGRQVSAGLHPGDRHRQGTADGARIDRPVPSAETGCDRRSRLDGPHKRLPSARPVDPLLLCGHLRAGTLPDLSYFCISVTVGIVPPVDRIAEPGKVSLETNGRQECPIRCVSVYLRGHAVGQPSAGPDGLAGGGIQQ